MTVIAWDGTTLAADKRANYSGASIQVRKIYRLEDGSLAGINGSGAHGMAILAWLDGDRDPDKYPKPASDNDDHSAHVLVITADRAILNYEGQPYPVEFDGGPIAMGAGRDFAMGAFAMGADAVRAVEIACELCCHCGGGIDTMTFEAP